MPKMKLINPERKPLTAEKLRELSGLHDLTDEKADEAIHSIDLFVKILYEFVKKKEAICIDNQQVVNLEDKTVNLNQAA
jgi:hypothetical protein